MRMNIFLRKDSKFVIANFNSCFNRIKSRLDFGGDFFFSLFFFSFRWLFFGFGFVFFSEVEEVINKSKKVLLA